MTKSMKYRDLTKRLRAAGFTSRQGKGDHEVWTGPTGTVVVITQSREVSPGLVRKALTAIEQEENR